MVYDIKDIYLADQGRDLIEWAKRDMPVLQLIKNRFLKEKPLVGVKLAACLHVTSETANLAITLKAGGAQVFLCASNPLSTNDAVAASLVKDYGIPTFAIKGEDNKTYYKHLHAVLDAKPNQTMDDGADLVSLIHGVRKELIPHIVGSTEETTTGVIRLRAMEKDHALQIPVLAVNDNMTKHLFDNRYGTGQSTIDGIIRATNILLAGRTFVVAGYGWCGKGLASRARGMGAHVVVTEVDPIKALEARMDGYTVMPLIKAIQQADVVVTVTGNKWVIDEPHLIAAKNGVILANSGHFDVEINKKALNKLSKKVKAMRGFVEEYEIKLKTQNFPLRSKSFKGQAKFKTETQKSNVKKIYLLAQGRLVNLAAAEGHPASVMDMSFAGQALASEYMWKHKGTFQNKVHTLPFELDMQIAKLKLKSERVKIDTLSRAQKKYLDSWKEGT